MIYLLMFIFICRYFNIFYIVFWFGIRIKYYFVNNWKWLIVDLIGLYKEI